MTDTTFTYFYDAIDLAFLTAGVCETHGSVRLPDMETLARVAEMLHKLYEELDCENRYGGVWAYEVAEPLGEWLGAQYQNWGEDDQSIKMELVEAEARRIIAQLLEPEEPEVVEPPVRKFIVVGRKPDHDNETITIAAKNKKEAEREFVKWLYLDEPRGTKREFKETHGTTHYIDLIVSGENMVIEESAL